MVTGSTGNSRMANMTSYNLPDGAPIYWNKIPILQDAFARFPDAEWVWWRGIDIIIMNMSLSIHDHVLSQEEMARNILLDYPMTGAGGSETGYRSPTTYQHEDINFVISMDYWGMNVGNFLMRRSEWSLWLLDLWIEPVYISQNWIFPENVGWTHVWQFHEIVRNQISRAAQNIILRVLLREKNPSLYLLAIITRCFNAS